MNHGRALEKISSRSGRPVAEITDMARKKGVDVIVDAAHSYGQLDFYIEDLGSDFIGM